MHSSRIDLVNKNRDPENKIREGKRVTVERSSYHNNISKFFVQHKDGKEGKRSE